MQEIKLKNGSFEPMPLVVATMVSLDNLLKNHVTAFYDLVMICRSADRPHPLNRYKPFGNNGKVLRDLALLHEDGSVQTSIRNIVLSAVTGDGLDMVLGTPKA
jgi:hypothetical protein